MYLIKKVNKCKLFLTILKSILQFLLNICYLWLLNTRVHEYLVVHTAGLLHKRVMGAHFFFFFNVESGMPRASDSEMNAES